MRKTYTVSYTEFLAGAPLGLDSTNRPGFRRVVVSREAEGRNALDAIRSLLATRLGDDFNPADVRNSGRKRVVLYGVTFEAELNN